jgi:hypothetical protein
MKTMTKAMLMGATLGVTGQMAAAAVTTADLVEQYRAEGYSWIEVTRGRTRIEVEAVRGTEKVEVVYDAETGAVLESESERASRREQERSGVEIRTRDGDFDDGADDSDEGDSDDDDDDDGDDDRDDGDDDRDDDGDDGDDDDDDDDDDDGDD